MQTLIQKWGDSLALRIPLSFVAEAQLEEDMMVEITLQEGKLVVTPIAAAPTLEGLLALITPENLHTVQDFGATMRQEEWK